MAQKQEIVGISIASFGSLMQHFEGLYGSRGFPASKRRFPLCFRAVR